MNTLYLRRLMDRYGAVGMMIVAAYLLGWHIWAKRRAFLPVSVAALGLGFLLFSAVPKTTVSQAGHTLYIGNPATHYKKTKVPLAEQISWHWQDSPYRQKARLISHLFVEALERNNHKRATIFADELRNIYPMHRSLPSKDEDWNFPAILGEIYLERGWLEEATTEFNEILFEDRPTVSWHMMIWGDSPNRQKAIYGMARIKALRGYYPAALSELNSAPIEANQPRCVEAFDAMMIQNRPCQIVWATAEKPYPIAVAELRTLMEGSYTPIKSRYSIESAEALDQQRQQAAVEAALTLGCFYEKTGKPADARACWTLVANHGDVRHNATLLARSFLRNR